MNKLFKTFIFTLIALFSLSLCGQGQAANSKSTAARVTTQSTDLNIRSKASVSSTKITTAKRNSYLTLISKQGEWWKVEYAKGKYGYAHENYLKKVTASLAMTVSTAEGSLNVRNGKGTSYKIKDKLPAGTYVVLLKSYDDWSRILYNGNKTGYVKSEFLKKPASASYIKIALDVPSFKQNDSRWANIKIGTQGDTLGSSGCTTTALAMTESFRLNQTLTPKDMVSRLSYAPSGILYWPSDYSVFLAGSNYLSVIYESLTKGKPVIFGMKTDGGSQHWVVITGHSKASASLSKASFTINDPGSNTRTLLSEVMEKYPNPYKIAVAK